VPYGWVFSLVHSADPLLAAGFAGVDRLSVYLAAQHSVPHCWHYLNGRFRIVECNSDASGAGIAWPASNLAHSSFVGGFAQGTFQVLNWKSPELAVFSAFCIPPAGSFRWSQSVEILVEIVPAGFTNGYPLRHGPRIFRRSVTVT